MPRRRSRETIEVDVDDSKAAAGFRRVNGYVLDLDSGVSAVAAKFGLAAGAGSRLFDLIIDKGTEALRVWTEVGETIASAVGLGTLTPEEGRAAQRAIEDVSAEFNLTSEEQTALGGLPAFIAEGGPAPGTPEFTPVSYTHLTLPTIYSV